MKEEADRNRGMESFGLKACLLLQVILLFTEYIDVDAQACQPSGEIRERERERATTKKQHSLFKPVCSHLYISIKSMCIYIYIYIEREREGDTETE